MNRIFRKIAADCRQICWAFLKERKQNVTHYPKLPHLATNEPSTLRALHTQEEETLTLKNIFFVLFISH